MEAAAVVVREEGGRGKDEYAVLNGLVNRGLILCHVIIGLGATSVIPVSCMYLC